MTKPKTEEEMYDRAFAVLREGFDECGLKDYKVWAGKGPNNVSVTFSKPVGSGWLMCTVSHLMASKASVAARALAILDAGIEEPTKIDRALSILRMNFPIARYEQHKCPGAAPRIYVDGGIALTVIPRSNPTMYALCYRSKCDSFISPYGVSLINRALDILNEDSP